METGYRLEVYLSGRKVGTLAPYQKYLTAFEYDREWLRSGYSISPFSLPLMEGVKIARAEPFDGLFGIFADSLPDGWGRLLVDRKLRSLGEDPAQVSSLARLAIASNAGKGALEYRPIYELGSNAVQADLDYLAEECRKLLESKERADLDTLFALGGSSGGARPKVVLNVDGEEWIIKFPSSYDPAEIGQMEYEYALCARACGIEIPEVRLFPSKTCGGYFGSRRFDRVRAGSGTKRIHMATASGLLEVSHRLPALDYQSLMALIWQLTRNEQESWRMFRLMCFNVFAHNRDDHSNNFSFLCEEGRWRLAPAYDLTYSSSLAGEHATTVAGERKAPSMEDILRVARKAGLKERTAQATAEEIRETVQDRLRRYVLLCSRLNK